MAAPATTILASVVSLCLMSTGYAQERETYKNINGVDVAQNTPSGELAVRWNTKGYRILLSDFSIAKNLPEEFKDSVETDVLGIDDPSGTLYFAMAVGPSMSKDWGVWSYGLETKKISALGEFEGTVLWHPASSADGRYIAFAVIVRNAMCPNAYFGVVDVRDKRYATISDWGPVSSDPPGPIRGTVSRIRWANDANFEFEGVAYDSEPCFAMKNSASYPVSGAIDITKAVWRASH
jgi:hypothetical protein